MRFRYSYLLAVFLTLLLAACGGQNAGSVNGTWNATATNTGATFTLQLTQNGTSLNGTLTIQGSAPISMTGTTTGSLISLSYQDASGTINLEASVNGNSMQGTFTVTTSEGTGSTPFTAMK